MHINETTAGIKAFANVLRHRSKKKKGRIVLFFELLEASSQGELCLAIDVGSKLQER